MAESFPRAKMKADGGEENWTMERREGHIRPWQIDVDLDVGVDPGGCCQYQCLD